MKNMMSRRRRSVMALCLAVPLLAVALLPRPAWSNDGACAGLAVGPVRWIVPFEPGGGFDTYARLAAPFVERRLGRTVRIDNISGAGGLVGTKSLRDAQPDGLTVGMLNAGGLLVAQLMEEPDVPDPVADFTLLGRFADQRYVWVVAADSPIRSFTDLAAPRERPWVIGVQDAGSASFVAGVLAADAAGVELEYVAGYRSSKDRVLALLRGEIDISGAPFETYLGAIEAGEVHPVLQVSAEPIADHPGLADVAVLGDVALARVGAAGQSADAAIEDVTAIGEITGAGPVMAAPAALPEPLTRCWRDTLDAVLADAEFLGVAADARRTVAALSGTATRSLLEGVAGRLERFRAVLKARAAAVRG